jgi:hypothetical protein
MDEDGSSIFVDLDKGEDALMIRAEQLEGRLGEGEMPLYELKIVAQYGREEENRVLAGNAIISRLLLEDTSSAAKAGKMKKIAAGKGYHPEVKKRAGSELITILMRIGDWPGIKGIALNPKCSEKVRVEAALEFVEFSEGGLKAPSAVIELLKTPALPADCRERLGEKAVDKALENGTEDSRRFLESAREDGGVPPLIRHYIDARTGGTIGTGKRGFGRDAGRHAAGRFSAVGDIKRAIADAVTERQTVGRTRK